MYIYVIINKLNKHWYVGKRTISINSSDFKRYYGSGTKIKRAIKENGKHNFEKIILEECIDNINLCQRELHWIKFYSDNYGIEKSYNMLFHSNYIGRERGFKQSIEHVQKRVQSRILSGNFAWTKESKERLSKNTKGRKAWNKGLKCESISLSKSGSKNPLSIKVIDITSGKIFDTISEAALSIGLKHVTLHQYLNGKRKNKTTLEIYAPSY